MNRLITVVSTSATIGAVVAVGASPAQADVPRTHASAPSAEQNIKGTVVRDLPTFRTLGALEQYVATHSTAVVVDVASGDPLEIEPAEPLPSGRINYRQPCGPTDAHWKPVSTPHAALCFYGAPGSKSVSARSNVDRWFTGKYTARGGWVFNGKQNYTLKLGPNSTARLAGGSAPANFGQIY